MFVNVYILDIYLYTYRQRERENIHVCVQPLEQQHGVVPDPDAEYHLFDRVVNVRENFSVPLGLRGTIIGIKGGKTSVNPMQTLASFCISFCPSFVVFPVPSAEREAEVLYEVLFDEEFAGGLTVRY